MDTLILKNYQLEVLVAALNYKMPLSYGRVRRNFFTIINPRLQSNEDSRKEICIKYAKKDPTNNKSITEPSADGKVNYVIEDQEDFIREYTNFSNEECVVDIMPSQRKDFAVIHNILLNSPVEMEIRETNIYSEICDAFQKALIPSTSTTSSVDEDSGF